MQISKSESSLPAPFRGAFAKAFPDKIPKPVFDALMTLLQVGKTDDLYRGLKRGLPETFCKRLLAALPLLRSLDSPPVRFANDNPVLVEALDQYGESGFGLSIALNCPIKCVALHRFAPRFPNQTNKFFTSQTLARSRTGVVVNLLFNNGAIEIV